MLAKVSATGSKIDVPNVVFKEWIQENNAILSLLTVNYYLYFLSFPELNSKSFSQLIFPLTQNR